MTYHLKPKRKKKWVPAVAVTGIVLFFVLINTLIPHTFSNVFSYISVPLQKTGSSISGAAALVTEPFASKDSLIQQNTNLQAQVETLKVQADQNTLLLQENASLKELLGRPTNVQNILANVVSKPPLTPYDTLIIDVGVNDKITAGDTVLADGVVPIGTVSEVDGKSSKVSLFSTAGEKLNVLINNTLQASADALGNGNFIIKLPVGSDVQEGDVINVPTLTPEVFGTVENIETDPNDPFEYIRFMLPVNISLLRFVEVARSATL